MTINEFLEETFEIKPGMPFCIRDRLYCADGFSMSVQAFSAAYCTPRLDLPSGYTAVEVGYPSERVEELMEFAEDKDTPAETVYAYVPVEVVDAVIEKHGGIKA